MQLWNGGVYETSPSKSPWIAAPLLPLAVTEMGLPLHIADLIYPVNGNGYIGNDGMWEFGKSKEANSQNDWPASCFPNPMFMRSSHSGMLPELSRRLQCKSSTSSAQIIYNGNFDMMLKVWLHYMAAVSPDWCDQQVCSFSFFPLSVILNEWDELNQTCQMYWGCFAPTGRYLQAYLAPWLFTLP